MKTETREVRSRYGIDVRYRREAGAWRAISYRIGAARWIGFSSYRHACRVLGEERVRVLSV
jgi:hypothetical protein